MSPNSTTALTLRIKVTGFVPVSPSQEDTLTLQSSSSSSSGGIFGSPVRRILTSMGHHSGLSSQTSLNQHSDEKTPTFISASNPFEATDVFITNMTMQSTVTQLKKELFRALGPASVGRYVRLIFAGRLLTPDSAPMNQFFSTMIPLETEDDSEKDSLIKEPTIVLHAVFAPPGVRGGHQAELSRQAEETHTPSSFFSRFASRRRGVGIGSNGVILSSSPDDDDDHDGDDDDDTDNDNDVDNQDSSDLESGRQRQRRSSPRTRFGFDRLRGENRLTRDEVEALRIYFAPQIDQFIQERHVEQDGSNDHRTSMDEDPAESARQLRLQMEDAWMETQGPFSEFRLNLNTSNPLLTTANSPWYRFRVLGRDYENNNDNDETAPAAAAFVRTQSVVHNTMWMGTDRDFFWGFFLGFFVGFMMIFWVWLPTVSHKQKLGILTGLCCHFVLNLIQDTSAVEDGTSIPDIMKEIASGY